MNFERDEEIVKMFRAGTPVNELRVIFKLTDARMRQILIKQVGEKEYTETIKALRLKPEHTCEFCGGRKLLNGKTCGQLECRKKYVAKRRGFPLDSCFSCGSKKNLMVNSRLRLLGNRYVCRKCNTVRHRNWSHKTGNMKKLYDYIREREAKSGARIAYSSVQQAVRNGKLKKEPCKVCKKTKVVAHHPHGYDNPLDVWWLCPGCHTDLHKKRIVIDS